MKMTVLLVMVLCLSLASCAHVGMPGKEAATGGNEVTVRQEAAGKSLSDDLGSPEKVALLEERVKACWNAFIKGDYERVFDLYDPFMRAVTNKYAYIGTLGGVKYHSFQLVGTTVEGNVATVKMSVVYSLPKRKVKLKEFSQGETPLEFQDTWVYVYDNWYREFRSELAERGVIEY